MGLTAAFISAPKISNLLLGLIIFFSATQLGYHFWPASALVYGIRVDYLAPTLYFLDLLLILSIIGKKITLTRWFVGLLPVLVVNLLFSHNPVSTLSWSLHLILYLSFILSLPKIYLLKSISFILSLALLFQVVLATAQVALGHSLQGPLYYLGERMVAVGAPSVATASFMGSTVLRAYGTFSHPNILAGWAVISLLILFRLKSNTYLLTSATALTTILVVLTQSRSAALALFGLVIPLYLLRSWRRRLFYFAILLTTSYNLLATGALSRAFDLSFSQRLNLQAISLQIIPHFPFFGTGANASISTYPTLAPNFRLLQPDHNSFTLLLSWFGLFGIFTILQVLPCTSSAQAREKCLQTLSSLGGLLPLLLLDHYLLTSPQGLFIFTLYLKVVHSYHAQSRR